MATVRYGVSVMNATIKRNNAFAKLIYHSNEVTSAWNELVKEYDLEEAKTIGDYNQVIEI